MHRLPIAAVALVLLLPAPLLAQQPPPAENVSYEFAEVLRAEPIYQRVILRETEERCGEEVVYERVGGRDGNTGGAVLGAIVGGAVGNQIGSGSGRVIATVGGAAAGAAIGHRSGGGSGEVVEEVRPGCQLVEVERESRELVGYEVEYRHKGEVFISRLNNDPGTRLQVRVAVTPIEEPVVPEAGN